MEGRTAKPTRVAIDELQLHDLKNMEAGEHGQGGKRRRASNEPALEVKQKARPARHEVAMEVRPPASGRDINRPMLQMT